MAKQNTNPQDYRPAAVPKISEIAKGFDEYLFVY